LPRIVAEFVFNGDKALERHGKEIAEEAKGSQPFFLREDQAAWIDSRRVRRAGFHSHDPGIRIRSHGNSDDLPRCHTGALGEHGHDTVLGIAWASNSDFFALEITRAFYGWIDDKIERDFVGLKHDAFNRRAFERRAHATAARAAVIDIAAQQRRDGKRTRNHDGFIVEAFVFEESFGIGNINREIVQVGLRDSGADLFGARSGRAHYRDSE
jgi:hypothetical protein